MPDTRPLRAVLVDDERLARRELRTLLAAHPETEIVGEAEDADAAEALLARLRADGEAPDVLFLDVQMPGRSGFDLLDDLDAAPDVVFVTAYDEHALRAFRVSALDYLLKPVDPERLAEAVGRVERRRQPSESGRPAEPAPADGERTLRADDRVFVKDGEQMHLVRLGSVRLFESVGNYTQLHFDGPDGRAASPLVHRSLSALEDRIDPALVARASRSQMVGLAHVVRLDDALNGGLVARLTDGTTVEFSRRRAQSLRDRLSL